MFQILTLLGPYKWPAIIGAVLFAILAFWGWLAIRDYNTEQRALAEFNKKQLEQIVAQQNKYIKQLEQISDMQRELSKSLQAKNDELNTKIDSIQKELEVKAPGAQNPASPYLKETINQLNKTFGPK